MCISKVMYDPQPETLTDVSQTQSSRVMCWQLGQADGPHPPVARALLGPVELGTAPNKLGPGQNCPGLNPPGQNCPGLSPPGQN